LKAEISGCCQAAGFEIDLGNVLMSHQAEASDLDLFGNGEAVMHLDPNGALYPAMI